MADEDVTPEVPGHVEPDPGVSEDVESEIPVGADALTDEQLSKAEEAGPAGGGDGGDDDALDVSAVMDDDAGDADADADASDDDAGDDDAGDDDADADADTDETPDDDTGAPEA